MPVSLSAVETGVIDSVYVVDDGYRPVLGRIADPMEEAAGTCQ
jgi:hypothetical protein